MTGLNIAAFLLGYAAIFVAVLAALAALGLLIAWYTDAARIAFSAGLLVAALILGLASLSFLAPDVRHDEGVAVFIVAAVSLLLAGSGQFIAALRGGQRFAGAFGCAAIAIVFLASPLLGGDWAATILGQFGVRLNELTVPLLPFVSVVPAAASAVIALLPTWHGASTDRLAGKVSNGD